MCFCKLVKLFYLCSILLLLERICTSIRLVCCLIHLSLSIKYLKWNKGNAKCGVSPRLKIKPCYLDLWPWKSIWFQILLRSKYVPSLVKIHWRMLILECSQGCLHGKNLTQWPWPLTYDTGLTLEGNSGKEVALWLLTSLCSSAKREVEVAL